MRETSRRCILIHDGQFSWGADETQLLSVLDERGWVMDAWWYGGTVRRYVEPDGDSAYAAYAALCANVDMVDGMTTDEHIDDLDPRIVGEFYPDASCSRPVWTLTIFPREGS